MTKPCETRFANRLLYERCPVCHHVFSVHGMDHVCDLCSLIDVIADLELTSGNLSD